MATIRHMAICTNNNRRLARFYRLIFGMEEVWNEEENSPYAFYMTDGYFNLNCLQIYPGLAEKNRELGINHFGFKVENLEEIKKRLAQLDPPIRLATRPQDGRYTEARILDPDGNGIDLTERGWGIEDETRLPAIRHVGIKTEDPDRLADFYKFIFVMKEVGRKEFAQSGMKAIYLSDGSLNLGLVRNPPVPKPGIQLLGFHVQSISEIEERLGRASGLTYKGESPLKIQQRTVENPYRTVCLQDPDGNFADLSQEGWEV